MSLLCSFKDETNESAMRFVSWRETSNRNSTPGHLLIGPSWDLFSQPWVFQGLALRRAQTITGIWSFRAYFVQQNANEYDVGCWQCLGFFFVLVTFYSHWSLISVHDHLDVCTESQNAMRFLCLQGAFSSNKKWGEKKKEKKSQVYRDLGLNHRLLVVSLGWRSAAICRVFRDHRS